MTKIADDGSVYHEGTVVFVVGEETKFKKSVLTNAYLCPRCDNVHIQIDMMTQDGKIRIGFIGLTMTKEEAYNFGLQIVDPPLETLENLFARKDLNS
jgi:hypothetical protein